VGGRRFWDVGRSSGEAVRAPASNEQAGLQTPLVALRKGENSNRYKPQYPFSRASGGKVGSDPENH